MHALDLYSAEPKNDFGLMKSNRCAIETSIDYCNIVQNERSEEARSMPWFSLFYFRLAPSST
jgi:hypothetical protein